MSRTRHIICTQVGLDGPLMNSYLGELVRRSFVWTSSSAPTRMLLLFTESRELHNRCCAAGLTSRSAKCLEATCETSHGCGLWVDARSSQRRVRGRPRPPSGRSLQSCLHRSPSLARRPVSNSRKGTDRASVRLRRTGGRPCREEGYWTRGSGVLSSC